MKARLTALSLCAVCLLFQANAAEPTAAEQRQFLVTKAKAEKGDIEAQFDLGHMYLKGTVVAKDEVEAAKWFRKAAEQNNLSAQSSLGFLYANGLGVKRDYGEAVKWARKAAEQNDATGQNLLGSLYANGKGAWQDFDEAVIWYRKAANQGDAKAQRNLGLSLIRGQGVVKNSTEAIRWLHKSAEQNDTEAQLRLGYAYFDGELVEQDFQEAKKWLQRATEQKSNDEVVKAARSGLREIERFPILKTATKRAWNELQKADSEVQKVEDAVEKLSKAKLLYSQVDLEDVDPSLTAYIEACVENFKSVHRSLLSTKERQQSAKELGMLVGALFGSALNDRNPQAGAAGGALLGRLAAEGLSISSIERLRLNTKDVFDKISAWEDKRVVMREELRQTLSHKYGTKFLNAVD